LKARNRALYNEIPGTGSNRKNMEIIFRGQHITISDDFRKYASDHLNKLSRYLPVADHAIVDVRREAKGDEGRYVVQVTVNANGTFLRAEERNFELNTAVDQATDALSRQAKRYKETKLLRSERRVDKDHRLPVQEDEPQRSPLPPDAELVLGRVVRMKHFPMEPMTEAEAIEQMELLGHNFFFFQDADKETLAVLYSRDDGDYGMILPDNA
jgi:putative sigma-54 modulation protein